MDGLNSNFDLIESSKALKLKFSTNTPNSKTKQSDSIMNYSHNTNDYTTTITSTNSNIINGAPRSDTLKMNLSMSTFDKLKEINLSITYDRIIK